MKINVGLDFYNILYPRLSIKSRGQSLQAIPQSGQTPKVNDDLSQLLVARQQVIDFRDALASLYERLVVSERWGGTSDKAASATSTSNLGLDMTGTAAELESTEEVNSTPTSFSPFGPDWGGASTAEATLDGTYDGSEGTGTLTFLVTRAGTHVTDHLEISVLDSGMQEIESIFVNKNDPLDQEYSLSFGLVFTLGTGDLVIDDTFTLDVYDAVGSAVDPDKSFSGVRNDNPNFEYGTSVIAGTFDVNGEAIDVYADDTINTVLTRITQSAANVTGSFDSGTETVVLTQKTSGSAPTIVVGSDTSGFLAATKLTGAVVTPGTDPATDEILADVAQFSTVTSGTITINGTDIAIDVNADTVNDVVDRINASAAQAGVSLYAAGNRFTIISEAKKEPLTISSGTTGFFSAVEISEGSYDPTQGDRSRIGVGVNNAFDIAATVAEAATLLNAVLVTEAENETTEAFISQFRTDIQGAVSSAFDDEGPMFRTSFGIRLEFLEDGSDVFKFSVTEKQRLVSALDRQADDVYDLLIGADPTEQPGLVENLLGVARDAETALDKKLESTEPLVDVRA